MTEKKALADKKTLDGLTRVTVREARENLAELLNRAAYGVERIVVLRHGKPVAAIVCVEDLQHLESEDAALDERVLKSLRKKSLRKRAPRKPRAAHRTPVTSKRRA